MGVILGSLEIEEKLEGSLAMHCKLYMTQNWKSEDGLEQ